MLIHRNYDNEKWKTNSNLLKSSSLRALQFQAQCLPKELGNMKHIRYLDLSYIKLPTLPETISTLYNLQTLKLSGSQIIELPTEMRYMINLRHLILDDCDELQCMPIGLGQLKYLRTLTKFVVNSCRGGTIGELNNLDLLCGHISLSGLESIRDGKDAQSVNLAAKTNLCSLELKWDKIINEEATTNDQAIIEAFIPHEEMKYLIINGYNGSCFPKWMMEDLNIRNLKRLKLEKCINCAEIPAIWKLSLLENLHLEKMESLRHIVGGRGKHVNGSESFITFPVLKVLTIEDLPNLENWREEDSNLVDFPNLNELVIFGCGKLKSIPVCMPLLASLKVFGSSEIKLHNISNFPMLSSLELINGEDNSHSEPDAFRPPRTLEEMEIVGYENVNPLEEEEEEDQLIRCQTKSLRKLTINTSNCFFSCGPTKVVALRFWKYFECLEYLLIFSCDAIVFWPEEEFRSLKCLKELGFSCCSNLRGSLQAAVSLSSPREHWKDSLPHLESLNIYTCPELVVIPMCSKSLTNLIIWDCPKLSREGLTHLTNLSQLKRISINNLTWGAWPDNMEHLPSLEDLTIFSCPGIESFPEGLQQRLSSLQYLDIDGCPALDRRCRVGGDYWHLVSSVPRYRWMPACIDLEVNERQSFSKKLLNCIRGK
ncbi:Disease resistance protein (CC-NBS-LRR class) family [Rhynchospora pubera]|uniref:Disease resistance protein (CC-NBS-LRR class) family n=1 Tax=Rhynchospora pubera TaxID=906938 RepID=A0AAV8DZB0_9POAL|nr:Disease resistance protein (CC-NBS-LRR class) family [Rhynchospora pubera]